MAIDSSNSNTGSNSKSNTNIFRANKTFVGQHDFAKPFCASYCNKNRTHCPYNKLKKEGRKLPKIQRWIDVELKRNFDLQNELDDEFNQKTHTVLNGYDEVVNYQNSGQYSCYCDGSGFEYDLMQMGGNVIGQNSSMESIYDIYQYGIETQPLQLSSWNSWLDKFQYDYRFGRVSDYNATTVMFPNVDNPWMMTEYVFQGVGKMYDSNSGSGAFVEDKEIVIQPPLYNPKTLKLINADIEISNSNNYDAKYKECDHTSNSKYKQFRKLENWDRFNGDVDKQTESNWTGIDAGVKLYKANVNVQCVKWGEHGNVPPHTINMTAPADYLDSTKSIAKIKPVWTMHVGAPVRANTEGIIGWVDNYAYIIGGQMPHFTSFDAQEQAYIYTIPASSNQDYKNRGKRQNNPPHPRNELMGKKPQEILKETGTIIHNGCDLLVTKSATGFRTGKATCKKIKQLKNPSDFNAANCVLQFGSHPCGQYVQSQKNPIIATYEYEAQNMEDYYRNQGYLLGNDEARLDRAKTFLSNQTGLPLADTFLLMGAAATQGSRMLRPDQYTPQQNEEWYSLDYEIQNGTLEQPQLINISSGKDGERNAQIAIGTGKYALDTRENANPYKGDDTNVYGDINTLSFHRFFASIMHCATQADCNPVCGLTQSWGYSTEEKAGGPGKCRYYKQKNGTGLGCPTSCVPKRGYEFAQAMKNTTSYAEQIRYLYNTLVKTGMWYLTFDKSNSEWIKGLSKNYYRYEDETKKIYFDDLWFKQCSNSNTKYIEVGISDKQKFNNCGNVYKKLDSNSFLMFELKLSSKVQSNSIDIYDDFEKKTYTATPIQYRLAQSSYFWYEPLTDSGNKLKRSSYNHVDADGHWFCKSDISYVTPTFNCLIIDNDKKFKGGYYPQYKDYSKMGDLFQYEEQSADDEFERENNAVGDRVYNHVPVQTVSKGYRIDESGLWIMDEREIGFDAKIVSDKKRKNAGASGTTCISIVKSKEVGGLMGITTNEVVNAAVFANDPYDLVVSQFREARKTNEITGEIQGRPMLQGIDGEYYAPVFIKNEDMLPTMRMALHCPKCDYYIAYKYYQNMDNTCPWCGTEYKVITGDKGIGMTPDSIWDSNASVIKKFFKLYAIGQVQVWGPPGTCVHTDAYFWKNQNHISNGFKRQIYHRLGDSNKDNLDLGGGWQFNLMSSNSEQTLGYPQSLGKYVAIPNEQRSVIKDQRYNKLVFNNKDVHNNMQSRYAMWNDIAPEKYIPALYKENNREDEGLISPYSIDTNFSLKMLSYDQMRVLRNTIQPMFAYTNIPLTQNDYPTLRASYDKREVKDQLIVYDNKRATVDPVILATTGPDGGDAYIEYFSGDLAIGNVREFYPPGYTWWFMKQVIGGRHSQRKGGWCHMDDGTNGDGQGCWPNTERTIAKCAIFLHGMLPLDKEILKAYVEISPGNSSMAYKQPLGRKWTGGPLICCHYHPQTKNHKHYGDGTSGHLHGNAGFGGKVWFDDEGLYYDDYESWKRQGRQGQVRIYDESNYQSWGISNNRPDEQWQGWYDFDVNSFNLPIMYDKTFSSNVDTLKTPVKTDNGVLGYAYNETVDNGWETNRTLTNNKTKEKYQYIYLDDNNDIHQQFTQEHIWRVQEKATIQKQIENKTYQAQVNIVSKQNSETYSFTETDPSLYQNYIPQQKQEITGYFDMSWTHTSNNLWGEYVVDENMQNFPITQETILQDSSNTKNVGAYSGSNKLQPVGNTNHIFDVTDIVKELYNKRISRIFECQAGSTIQQVLDSNSKYDEPKIGGTLREVDKDILDVIAARNNDDLLDMVSFPQTENNGDLPPISTDGDKYPLAPKYIEIPCRIKGNIYHVTQGDKKYRIGFEYENSSSYVSNSIAAGDYSMEGVLSELKNIFKNEYFDIKKETKELITIKSREGKVLSVDIMEMPFGIAVGVYKDRQNRITSVSSYSKGYHPSNLLKKDESGWRFRDYQPRTKSFVIDLASAPVCLQQKNWRYREGYVDYSSCMCKNEQCEAYHVSASIYSNMKQRVFDKSSAICPFCGKDLDKTNLTIVQPDRIMTYTYDKMFSQNPIISSINILPYKDEIYSNDSQFVTVSVRPAESNYWKTLISFNDSNSHSWTGNPNDIERARYVKVECTVLPVQVQKTFQVDKNNYNADNWELIIKGDFSDMQGIDFRGKTITEGSNSNTIISSILIDDERMSLALEKRNSVFFVGLPPDQITLQVDEYIGGIQKLQIKGKHYKTEDNGLEEKKNRYLTMTGQYEMQAWKLSYNQGHYHMSQVPTQIKSVQIGQSDGGGIVLTASDNENVRWTTKKIGKIRCIEKGSYYYDALHGDIIIPLKDQNNVPFSDFEKSNSNDVSFLPTTLSIVYWGGNGSSVTLPASATGNGPSYQLEKGAIRVILDKNKLPSNGKSCKMVSPNGSVKTHEIPWSCFNPIPSGLDIASLSNTFYTAGYLSETKSGKFGTGNYNGNELANTAYHDDTAMINLFGEHCCGLRGHCTTKVTFVGAPNKALCGKIRVMAQDITETTVKLDTNTTVKYSERTGGLDSGVLVIYVQPNTHGDVKRTTITYDIPKLYIYAKERKLQSIK